MKRPSENLFYGFSDGLLLFGQSVWCGRACGWGFGKRRGFVGRQGTRAWLRHTPYISPPAVIPTQAGILVGFGNRLFLQKLPNVREDSRPRGNDGWRADGLCRSVGCVAPRRRTRSLLGRGFAPFQSEIRNRVRGLRHTPYVRCGRRWEAV